MKQHDKIFLKRIVIYSISSALFINSFELWAMDPDLTTEKKRELRRQSSGTKDREKQFFKKNSFSQLGSNILKGHPQKIVPQDEPCANSGGSNNSLSSPVCIQEERNSLSIDEINEREKVPSSSSSLSPLGDSQPGAKELLDHLKKNDIEQPTISPSKKENEQEKFYIECINSLFSKNNKISKDRIKAANILLYTYPLFLTEAKLFTHLNTLKKDYGKIINEFLRQLLLKGFPNGVKNFQSIHKEFNDLKNGLKYPPMLDVFFLNALTPLQAEIERQKEIYNFINQNDLPNKSMIDAKNFIMESFVDEIITRDNYLFQNISLHDLKKYGENLNSPPESIQLLIDHFNRTAHWVALQIVSACNNEDQFKQIKKFCGIGCLLLLKNDFHGALQIATAFNYKSVERLIPKHLRGTHWIQLTSFAEPIRNFGNYRNLLALALKKRNSSQINSEILPAFPIIGKDLIQIYEHYKKEVGPKVGSQTLEAFGNLTELFSQCSTKVSYRIDTEYFKFVCEFHEIHPETLEVFSDLSLEWQSLPKIEVYPVKELKDWTPLYFACLLKNEGCADQIRPLFMKGIYDGPELIKYMGPGNLKEQIERLHILKLNQNIINTITTPVNLNQNSSKTDEPRL